MIKVKAIILDIRDWREADRILTIYTEKQGKIEVLVRGARKIKSKLAGLCQPFFILDLFLVRGRSFYHLTGGEIIKQFKKVGNDYQKLVLISRYFNLVDQLVKVEKPESKIFRLIIKFLEKIETANLVQAEVISQAFLIKFLSFLGYRPELKKCLDCSQEIFGWAFSRPRRGSPKWAADTPTGADNALCAREGYAVRMLYFSPKRGGVICSLCHQLKDQNEIEISKQTLDLFQQLLYQEFSFWLTPHLFEDKFHFLPKGQSSKGAGLKPIKFQEEEIKKVSFLIEKFLEWRGILV